MIGESMCMSQKVEKTPRWGRWKGCHSMSAAEHLIF